jgi:hypothetical protein
MNTRGGIIAILGLILCIPATVQAVTWTRVEELPASDIEALALYGTILFATGSDTVYQGAALGTTWSKSNPVGAGDAPIIAVMPAGGSIWAGSFGSGVIESPDDGQSWNDMNNGLVGMGANHVVDFAVRDDTLFAATEGAGVFALALASPTTWIPFNDSLPVFTAGSVSAISLSGTTLVAPAGPNGLVYRLPQGAASWQEIAVRPPLLPGFLATDLYTDGTNLLVADGTSMFHSTDDAQSWARAGTGLPQGAATFMAGDGSTVYAVVDFMNNTHQFFASQDAGDSWQPIEGVANAFVYEIEVAGDKLFAAQQDGLWWTQPANTTARSATWGQLKTHFHD